MFEFFNRRKKLTYLNEDLKPSERIRNLLQEYILPELTPFGFKFNNSDLTFTRQYGDFENTISFQKNKWNKGNEVCAFKPIVGVQSKILGSYYSKLRGDKSSPIGLCGEYDVTNIKDWNIKYFDGYYDLAKVDNLELIKILKENILNAGLNYLDQFKNYSDVVSYYYEAKTKYFLAPYLFDLCFLNNDKECAEAVLKWFIEFERSTTKELPETLTIEMREREYKFNITT